MYICYAMQENSKTKLLDFAKFINWHDIAFVGLVQILLKFGFINLFNFETLFSNFLFFLLVFSVTFTTIAGYLINSYYKFKQINSLVYSIVLTILGLLLAVFVSYKVEKPENSFIFLGFGWVVILVSINLVNRSFVKTIAISMLMAFSLLINWWYNEPIVIKNNETQLFLMLEYVVIIFSLILFAVNIIRAMIYSLKNINKDKEKNKETFPIVFGIKRTKEVIFFISMLINVIVVFSVFTYATQLSTYFIVFTLQLIPQFFLLFKLSKAESTTDYKQVLKILDIILYSSAIFIPLIGFLIKSNIDQFIG